MILSTRLSCILNMVSECEKMADIGTDHGYLVIEAIKNKKAKTAIASDINKGPIERARRNVKMSKLGDYISCRLGPGMTTLESGEVNCVCIAGMGGNLIRDIILQRMDVVEGLDQLILQPSQNPEVLRKFLLEGGFEILEEDICIDNDIFYEIIKVRYTGSKVKLSELDYEISSMLMKSGKETFGKFIEWKIKSTEKIMTYIDDSFEKGRLKKEMLEEKKVRLKEKLDEFYGR